MNPFQIQNFLAVAKYQSFTKAAEILFISQPVLSRQIAAMEVELGVSLFHRGRRGVQLTSEGEIVHDHFKEIAREYSEMLSELSATKAGQSGTLRIGGISNQQWPEPLHKILSVLEERFPNIDVILSQHELGHMLKDLRDGEIDMSILMASEVRPYPYIDYVEIGRSDLYLVLPKRRTADCFSVVDKTALEGLSWLTLSSSVAGELEYVSNELKERFDFRPEIKVAPNVTTLSLWLTEGKGFSVLNDLNQLINKENLLIVPLEKQETIALAWNIQSDNMCLPAVVRCIQKELKEGNI